MQTRAIVRDPHILAGRWRLEGTTLAVAEVKAAFCADPESALDTYQTVGLTSDDAQAAISFIFPTVRPVEAAVHHVHDFASITVNCSCGEDVYKTVVQPVNCTVECLCGRRWHLINDVVAEVNAEMTPH